MALATSYAFYSKRLCAGAFRPLLYGMVLLVGTLVGLEIPLVMRILKRNVALKDLVSRCDLRLPGRARRVAGLSAGAGAAPGAGSAPGWCLA